MIDQDFQRVEAALGLRLPPSYRGMMNPYSFQPRSTAALFEIPDNPSTVINLNKTVRADNPFNMNWPRQYFIFGSDGESVYYYLDTTEKDGPIYSADATTGEYHQVAENLDAWAEPRLPDIGQLDQELDNRRKKKTDETEVVSVPPELLDEAERDLEEKKKAKQRLAKEADEEISYTTDIDKYDRGPTRRKAQKPWWQFWK